MVNGLTKSQTCLEEARNQKHPPTLQLQIKSITRTIQTIKARTMKSLMEKQITKLEMQRSKVSNQDLS
jgi:hypothetical protein